MLRHHRQGQNHAVRLLDAPQRIRPRQLSLFRTLLHGVGLHLVSVLQQQLRQLDLPEVAAYDPERPFFLHKMPAPSFHYRLVHSMQHKKSGEIIR